MLATSSILLNHGFTEPGRLFRSTRHIVVIAVLLLSLNFLLLVSKYVLVVFSQS